jgi:protein-S-isoprenylcysteine O-methyltransferase Ste14
MHTSLPVTTLHSPVHAVSMPARRFSDFLLFSVTLGELVFLVRLTPEFTFVDWIYISAHLLVLAIAFTRPPPIVQDRSPLSAAAIIGAYAYPYAQMSYLEVIPGEPGWPSGGLVFVTIGACLSVASLLSLGRSFGIRPALRSLATNGPYHFVRHPMYLSYVLSDIGYNLQEWNAGTIALTVAGWTCLLYRILAEEHVLSRDTRWPAFAAAVPYRLLPGIW